MKEWILNLLGIGRSSLIDDSGDVQLIQVTEGAIGSGGSDRVTDKVMRAGEFGLASVPPNGSEVVILRRNARRGQPIIIATGHRASRPTGLRPGDSGIYDVRGAHILLTEDGIEIDAQGQQVTVVNASRVRCECDIETTGDVISRCDGQQVSLNALRDAYDEHDHPPVAGSTSWGTGPPNLEI